MRFLATIAPYFHEEFVIEREKTQTVGLAITNFNVVLRISKLPAAARTSMHIAPGINWIHPKAKRTHAVMLNENGEEVVGDDHIVQTEKARKVSERIGVISSAFEKVPDDCYTPKHPTYKKDRTVFIRSIKNGDTVYKKSLVEHQYVKDWLGTHGISEEDLQTLKKWDRFLNNVNSNIEKSFVNCINPITVNGTKCKPCPYDFSDLFNHYHIGRIGYFSDGANAIRSSTQLEKQTDTTFYIIEQWEALLDNVFLDCVKTDRERIWKSVLDNFLCLHNFKITYTSKTGVEKTVTFHIVE